MLPAGYTRLLVPAYEREQDAPALPLFGYTFACVVDDGCTSPRCRPMRARIGSRARFATGELEAHPRARVRLDPGNQVLAQVALCSREYGCFTAQNVFLERGEAALPVSPKCNARCVGCISEQEPDAGLPSPQTRITYETRRMSSRASQSITWSAWTTASSRSDKAAKGEPLLRSIAIAAAIERIRAVRSNGTINLNTNGSMPSALERCIDAGLDAVRVSLNSFRPQVYAAYYRPDRVRSRRRLRVDPR